MENTLVRLKTEKKAREDRVEQWVTDVLRTSLKATGKNIVNLEIGCGHGHWLTSFATKEINQNFVGIDLITKRIEKAVAKAEKRNLKNLCFCKADAQEFLELCHIKIANTYIMYPDPWPKLRHHKRRLIQPAFLDLLASKTIVGGRLFFMTDHLNYYEWSVSNISESVMWVLSKDDWPHEASSYFQNILPKNQILSALRI